MKGAPFLSQMVYKSVMVGPRGGASSYKTLFSTPREYRFQNWLNKSWNNSLIV